jgi:uncharacterized protein CbrC (UPF0167 family)
MSLKPICVPCQRFFRPKKNAVNFIEGMPDGRDAYPGTSEPERWKPYKLWQGDEWICHGCDAVIIVGTGQSPIAEHYQADFAAKAKERNATFQVNDC